MPVLENLKKKVINKSRFQDIFIIGILAVSAVLVLGLFPKTDTVEGTARIYFIYLLMVIPIIVAIYFIFSSFRKKLYSDASDISSSIIFKMMLSFVSVAILPSLIIIIISNNIINNMISEFITEKSVMALEESLNMSYSSIKEINDSVESELEIIKNRLKRKELAINAGTSRKSITEDFIFRKMNIGFYKILKRDMASNEIKKLDKGNFDENYEKGIRKFLCLVDLKDGITAHNISIENNSILLGILLDNEYAVLLYKIIPKKIYERIEIYESSLKKYDKGYILTPYFQTGVGILLLFMAISVVLVSISVSFFLSRGITRPVLELAKAAGEIASGNFKIRLNRESPDELAFLFNSFNVMVKQLDESRKLMYQAQRLEAWREVAKRLVHEIKNPLTPIRLSAERIQKKFKENHPEIGKIILSGTETIVEEIKVLMMMLNEFSKFARLPEMKGVYQDINPIIESCVNFFVNHERIIFNVELDNSVPKLFLDKILMRQALTNILQNSVEVIEEKGNVLVKSELVINQNEKTARITVKDDGPGIVRENLERVFEPAFSTKESGTGLGLAIAEKIILEHHGRIYCRSEEGKGAEFIIELPVS